LSKDLIFSSIKTIAFLIVLSGCSSTKTENLPEDYEGVSLSENEADRSKKSINISADDNPDAYGPDLNQNSDYQSIKVREPVIGIVLGPGLYRTSIAVGILKELEKANIRPHIITGFGMGAVVSFIYAKSKNAEILEWELFNFYRKVKRVTPYSKNWKKIFVEYFSNRYGDIKLETTELTFLFPALKRDKKMKLSYIRRGKFKELLSSLVGLSKSTCSQRYCNAMLSSEFNLSSIKDLGADILIFIDSMGNRVNVDTSGGHVLGIYNKIKGVLDSGKMNFDIKVEITEPSDSIDNLGSVSEFIKLGEKRGRLLISELNDGIKLWKENHR
jgi:hypothetical protein